MKSALKRLFGKERKKRLEVTEVCLAPPSKEPLVTSTTLLVSVESCSLEGSPQRCSPVGNEAFEPPPPACVASPSPFLCRENSSDWGEVVAASQDLQRPRQSLERARSHTPVEQARASGSRLSIMRTPRRSLDVTLEELPPVEHLAESEWTRALTGNIKSIAQVAHEAMGTSTSIPSSPGASNTGARLSLYTLRRRQSSAMGYVGGQDTQALQTNPLIGSCSILRPELTTTAMETFDTRDDGALGSASLPNVVPAALLDEAARAGVSLQVDLDSEVAITGHQPLGKGASGAVYKALYKGRPCAIKMLPQMSLFGSGTAELHSFVQEVVVLASLRHTNIVSLLGASLQPPNVFLVAELCERSLDAWLHPPQQQQQQPQPGAGAGGSRAGAGTGWGGGSCSGSGSVPAAAPPPMSSWQMLKVALDVATGLQYMHERQPAIVHRDLKPANILIDANGTAKISDFGLARVKVNAVITTKAPEVGSIGYMAPECFTSENGLLTDKCDTWSLGVVLYEMVSRKRPWPGLTLPEYYREVVVRKSRLAIPQDDNVCPMALRRLISSCWNDDPQERPSCAHIVAELTRMLKYCPREP